MKEMIPLVMNGKKYMTTRLETNFRLKLDIGDTIYIYSGIRTKEAKKHGEAIIVDRWRWNQSIFNQAFHDFMDTSCPIGIGWEEFSKIEGFEFILDFTEFFEKKRYRDKKLITYQFELVK